MDNAIKSALSPVVRARRSALGFVRGRLYAALPSPDAAYDVIRVVSEHDIEFAAHASGFAPMNAPARRLLARPVSPEVRAYRRKVLRALNRASMAGAVRVVRRVRP